MHLWLFQKLTTFRLVLIDIFATEPVPRSPFILLAKTNNSLITLISKRGHLLCSELYPIFKTYITQ